MSHYKHLSIEEREKLYLMHGQGKSFRSIAKELGRSPSTISREYQRGKGLRHSYLPSRAQKRYWKRRKNCGRKSVLLKAEYKEKIRHYIEDLRWSPEEISNRLKIENNAFQISFISIYRAIWNGILDTSTVRTSHRKSADRFIFKLRRKGKRRRKNGETPKRGKFPILHCIDERPIESTARTQTGHFEGDTVMGKKGGSRLVTLVDRRSRYTLISKTRSGSAEDTRDAMIQLLKSHPEIAVSSITPDRGHEFARYQEVMENFPQLTFYFPAPYAPWERGTNENTNGLIREYSPKGKPIEDLSDLQIQKIQDDLNYRPRKCLNWRTPFEVHFQRALHLT